VSSANWKWKGRGCPPPISAREAAKEFGISANSLGALLRNYKDSPKQKFRTQKDAWFNAAEIRAWLAAKLGREANA
jgi:transposase